MNKLESLAFSMLQYRAREGISQEQLSLRTGVGRRSISDLELGRGKLFSKSAKAVDAFLCSLTHEKSQNQNNNQAIVKVSNVEFRDRFCGVHKLKTHQMNKLVEITGWSPKRLGSQSWGLVDPPKTQQGRRLLIRTLEYVRTL